MKTLQEVLKENKLRHRRREILYLINKKKQRRRQIMSNILLILVILGIVTVFVIGQMRIVRDEKMAKVVEVNE